MRDERDRVRSTSWTNFLKFSALLVFLAGSGYYLSLQKETLAVILKVKPKYVFMMAGIDFLFLLSNTMILKILLNFFKISLPTRECLSISTLSGIGNFLPSLRGGTIGKAVYFKKKYALPYSTFIAATSAVALISLSLSALVGVIAILLIGLSTHSLLRISLSFFAVVNLLFCLLLLAPSRVMTCRWKIFHRLSGIANGFDLIRRDRRLLTKIYLFLSFNFILCIAELALSYAAFSIDIPLVKVVLMDSISRFSDVIKILPGNLGVYEGSIALSSHVLGVGFREGLLAAGLVRAVSIIDMLIFAIIFGLRPFAKNSKTGMFDIFNGSKRNIHGASR